MSNENIIQLFIAAAHEHPERRVLMQGSNAVSYQQLLQEVKETAAYYRKRGLGRGNKVLVFKPISIGLYRTVLALLYIGAVPVFLDEWVSLARLKACCHTVPCKGMIASPLLIAASYLLQDLRKIPVKIAMHGRVADSDSDPATVSGDDTALITFTTGSTGTPKAANRTHQFLAAQLAALQPLLSQGEHTSLTTLPIVVLLNIGLGITSVLPPKGFKAKQPGTIPLLANEALRHHATNIIASPAILLRMAEYFNSKRTDTSHIVQVLTGGGPVFPEDAQALVQAFPNAAVTAVYGSTEAEPIAHIAATALQDADEQVLSTWGLPVGQTDPAAQVAIIPYTIHPIAPMSPAGWAALQLPHGSAGEIVVSGNHVLKNYINNEAAVQQHKIMIAGTTWHRTGDMGRMDAAGNIYLLGRCAEAFTWQGRMHFPFIAAYLLRRRLGIADVAMLFHQGKPYVVTTEQSLDKALLNKELESLSLQLSEVRTVRRIPKDPRHHTKTDTERLRKMI